MASAESRAGFPADRRSEPRETADDPVKLVTRSGAAVDARLMDRSLRGLRVRSDQADGLQGQVTVLAPSAGAAYIAQVVWRRAPELGLSISRTVDMRTAHGPDTADIRRLWLENIAVR